MSRWYRPSWPASRGDDYEKHRSEKQMESHRFWSSPEDWGLTQVEFEALQEQNNPWPRSVRDAVDGIGRIADGHESLPGVEPEVLADQIAELVRPIVQYLDYRVPLLEEKQRKDRIRREEAAADQPWYFEPGVPDHVMRWESMSAFRRSAEQDLDAKLGEKMLQSLLVLFRAADSLAEIRRELDVEGTPPETRAVELAQMFMEAWKLARHP